MMLYFCAFIKVIRFMKKHFFIVIVLSLLAALEPLSIDIYLPAFNDIVESLGVSMGSVQISLSVFLAGFAVGQLLWGPVSDYYGRKNPLIIAMLMFTFCSIIASQVDSIAQLWVVRFFQAFSGCAGVVVGRAVVNDLFEGNKRVEVFSLLIVISGVSPIIAPALGNFILKIWHWQGIFYTMAIIGVITVVLTVIFLPKKAAVSDMVIINPPKPSLQNMVIGYIRVMGCWQFVIYTFIGAMAYAFLMTYVSNAPFIIMTVGGMSNDVFSVVFAINALGLILGTLLIGPLRKKYTSERITMLSLIVMLPIAALLIVLALIPAISVIPILVVLFFNLVVIGMLMSVTTSLALEPFTKESGTASALMGFLQLFFTFVFSAIVSSLQGETLLVPMIALFLCAMLSFIIVFLGRSLSAEGVYFKIGSQIKKRLN